LGITFDQGSPNVGSSSMSRHALASPVHVFGCYVECEHFVQTQQLKVDCNFQFRTFFQLQVFLHETTLRQWFSRKS